MAKLSKEQLIALIQSMPESMTFEVSKHKELFAGSYFIHVSSESCTETEEMKKIK